MPELKTAQLQQASRGTQTLPHPQLINLLQKAYSAEKAAAYAYIGHAASVKNPLEKILYGEYQCLQHL